MVKAIQFVVRDSAGGTARGSIAGDGSSNFIQMGIGDEVSLNLSRQSIASYTQQGDDLIVTLIDGRQIVLDGYFNTTGEPNQLYLSQNGEVIAVEFSPAGDGTLFASYGGAEGWDKYSSLDALRFAQGDDLALAGGAVDEPAGMAMFAPGLVGLGGVGAGLAGLGVVGAVVGGGDGDGDGDGDTGGDGDGDGDGDTGGDGDGDGDGDTGGDGDGDGGGDTGGDGDGDGDRRPPTVDPQDPTTVTTNTDDKTLDVSGTGEPGDSVTVTIGDETQTTIIGEDGTWTVEFPEDDLPADGSYVAEVVFDHGDGTTTTLPGPDFILDLTPPDVSITEGSQSVGHIENAADYTDGVRIAGTGEAGATVTVGINGHSHTTVIGGDGTWSVVFPTSEIGTGEYTTGITVTARDPLGNTTVITDTLVVDTVPHPIGFNQVTADNTVSHGENTTGFAVNGTSTAGAVLTVTVEAQGTSYTQTVTVRADGSWTLNIPSGTLPGGEYDATVTASTVDGAGNASTETHSFRVDTLASVAFTGSVAGDNIVNRAESTNVVLTGTAEPGSVVSVSWQGSTLPATVAANGSWSVTFPAISGSSILTATTATVTATDAYGNTATASRTIQVDLGTSVAFDAVQAGDNVVSGIERNGGVTLTGTGEPGATVTVEFGSGTRTLTVGSGGTWSAHFTQAEIPTGNGGTETARVTSTDQAGNTASASHAVVIDTLVAPLAITGTSTGADNVLNNAEAAGGLTVTGSVEAGSQVMVGFGSYGTFPATVSGGTWSVIIPAGVIPPGETSVNMTVTAIDRYGNSLTLPNHTVVIDRIVRDFTADTVLSGDGYVNAHERLAGVPFGGTAEPGARVEVVLSNGHSLATWSDSAGNWSVTIPAGYLPEGNGVSLTATVRATDIAGNTAELPARSVTVDTVAPETVDPLKIVRDGTTVSGLYTDTDGEQVAIYRVDTRGEAVEIGFDANENVTTIVGTSRVITDHYDFHTGVPDGSYLVIQNTDAAGNESSTLFIVDNTGRVDVSLSREGLSGFDFGQIDLTLAPEARLTLTNADLLALTGGDNELIIRADRHDSVRLEDADAAGTRVVNGQTYAVYTMEHGTVLISEETPTSIF